jgi:hypothetical protein
MSALVLFPLFPSESYSHGDGLDGFQFQKILLNNCVNEGNTPNVSSQDISAFALFPTVNLPVTGGDHDKIRCSTKQVVRRKQQSLPIRSHGIHHSLKNRCKTK